MLRNSELTIFRATGLSFKRIIAPVVVLSVIITYLCYFTSDKLVPYAAQKTDRISGYTQQTQFLYTQKDKFGNPTQTVVVSKSKVKKLYNVIVLDFSKEVYSDVHQLSTIYFAKNGEVLDDKWQLYDIVEYRISKDGIFDTIGRHNTMSILNSESAKNAYTIMKYSTKKREKSQITILKII